MTHPTRPKHVATLRAAEACFLAGDDERAVSLANLACIEARNALDAVVAAEAALLRHSAMTFVMLASHAGWPRR